MLPYGSLHDTAMMLVSGRNCGVGYILGVILINRPGFEPRWGARFSEIIQTGPDAKTAGAWR